MEGSASFSRILEAQNLTVTNGTNSTRAQIEPKTPAQVFMTNLIYGITAFIGLVAFILCCVAVYLLCQHCHQNKKVIVISGKEYYVRPPSGGSGSETSRDLINGPASKDARESDPSSTTKLKAGKVLP